MGCGESTLSDLSKRKDSLRSWMGDQGSNWKQLVNTNNFQGFPGVKDTVQRITPSFETAQFREKITKDFGDGALGLRDNEAVESLVPLLEPGQTFGDEEFPADLESIYYSGIGDREPVTWIRPTDLCDAPQLMVKGLTPDDVKQGDLGDSWFLAAVAALGHRQDLLAKVIPPQQVLFGQGYTGMTKFNLWRFGKWVTVYVDDQLPSKDNKLIYAHSPDEEEFWVSLLEKAYAKLHGSFEAIQGGYIRDAFVDLTGGVVEHYTITDPDKSLYMKITKASLANAFIACTRRDTWDANWTSFRAKNVEAIQAKKKAEEEAEKAKEEAEDNLDELQKEGIEDLDDVENVLDGNDSGLEFNESSLEDYTDQDFKKDIVPNHMRQVPEPERTQLHGRPNLGSALSSRLESAKTRVTSAISQASQRLNSATSKADDTLHNIEDLDKEIDEFHMEDPRNGLCAEHAYTVIDAKRIGRKSGAEMLIKVKNPWGRGEEWEGPWSDHDDRWKLIDEETKKWLNFSVKDDGEFWMSFKDFCMHFSTVTICSMGDTPADNDGDGTDESTSQILQCEGSWVPGENAGGCRNNKEFFLTNPQYNLDIPGADTHNAMYLKTDTDAPSTCSVVISLMQEHRRSQKHLAMNTYPIGFYLFKTEEKDRRIEDADNGLVGSSGPFLALREVTARFELEPGNYVIIPATYRPNVQRGFLLRAYATQPIALYKLSEDSKKDRDDEEENNNENNSSDEGYGGISPEERTDMDEKLLDKPGDFARGNTPVPGQVPDVDDS